MTPHEELRALLGKLPNPKRAMELLEQVVAAPESGDVDDDMLEAGMAHVAQRLATAEEKLRNVVLQLCAANIKAANLEGQLRKADADKADADKAVAVVAEPVAWLNFNKQGDVTRAVKRRDSWCKTPVYMSAPAFITRARLDELLAAEKWMVELQSILRGIDEDAKSAGTIIGFASKVFKRLKSIRVAISASNAEVKPS